MLITVHGGFLSGMTFSHEVKIELMSKEHNSCCALAQLSAIFAAGSTLSITREGISAILRSESREFLDYTADMLQHLLGVNCLICTAQSNFSKPNKQIYELHTPSSGTRELLGQLGVMFFDGDGYTQIAHRPDKYIIEQNCCKVSYLRGLFLACGSITVPLDNSKNTGYHMHMLFQSESMAREASQLLAAFDILPKMTRRHSDYSVYIKEVQMISDFLVLTGASAMSLKLQTITVERDVKNNTNRQTNCIIANLDKTVDAAIRQIEAINLIEQTIGLERLPERLRKIAKLRQEYPDVSLEQIALLSGENLTKSGINHRMRKIISIADNL